MTNILLHIYFAINLFWAGFYLAEHYKWNDVEEKVKCVLITFSFLFIGTIFLLSVLAYIVLLIAYNFLDEYLQLSFFFTFYFTNKWSNLEKDILVDVNERAIKKGTLSFSGKLFTYCVGLINLKNNYTHK